MSTRASFTRMFVAGAAAAIAACGSGKPPEHGTLIANPDPAPVLRLTDATGKPFDLAAQQGRKTFVFFGYTHCPDACPTTLTDWARARALLGSQGASVHFVFVSVDPARDTPEIAAHYARQFDTTFTGLVASAAALDSVKAAWGFAVEHEEMPGMKPGDYGVDHPAGVYFVDGDGRMKFVFAPGSTPQELASDLKRLM